MDVTALGLGVDSDGLIKGTKALGDFAASSDKAGKSSDRFSETQSRSLQAIASMSRQLEKITALLSSIDKATAASAAGFAAQSSAMQQAATAAAVATRATAELSTSTTKLSINFTQSAAAAQSLSTATQSAAAANQQQAASATQAATATQTQAAAATQAATAVQQLDAHVQAYQAHLAAMPRAAAPFDAHIQAYRKNLTDVQKSLKLTAAEGLGFTRQFADIGVTAAMGMNPFMIALQQGPQLFDILQMKAIQTQQTIGTVAKSIAAQAAAAFAPFLPAIAAVAAAASGLALVMQVFVDEVDKSAKHNVTWGDVALGTFDAVTKYLGDKLAPAFKLVGATAGTVWEWIATATKKAVNIMIASTSVIPQVIGATLDKIPAAFGDAFYSAANLAIKAINWLITKTAGGVNTLVDTFNSVFGTNISKVVVGSFEEIANPYKGGMTKLGSAGAKAFTAAFERDYLGEFAKFVSPFADKRAAERLAKDAKDTGGKAGKDAGKAAADEFAQNFMADLANSLAKYAGSVAENFGTKFLAGLDAEFAKFTDRVQKDIPDTTSALQRAAEANVVWNGALRQTIELLDQIGGKASGLGDIGAALEGLMSGDWSGARGPVSSILKTFGGVTWRDPSDANGPGQIRVLREEIVKGLDQVFGGSGSFAKTMNAALENAGLGYAAGSLVNGAGNSGFGSMVGGALGGEFGKVAGTAIAKNASSGILKALGGAAGPLGSIVGGVLGGVLGGLFKKTPTGSVILGQGGVVGTSGNGGRDASGLGASVLTALDKIGTALGVQATGKYSVSIGMRGDAYRVDTTGAGRTKESDVLNFGGDAEAAVKAAIKDAISDGVFEGLSEGMKSYIMSGDLETQLNNLAGFRSALSAADAAKDPMGAEFNTLDRARAEIMNVANAIGASMEEVAKLEEYYGTQRAEIAKKYAEEALDIQNNLSMKQVQILELEGRAAEALDLARQIETSTMTAAEKALQLRIYALQDEATAAAKAQQAADELAATNKTIADEREALERQLLPLMGGMVNLRQRELAAINPANRAIQETIWYLEDLKKVTDERTGLELRLAEATGNTAKADAIRLQQLLDSVDVSNRALAEQVFWEEKRANAMGAATAYAQRFAAANDNLKASLGVMWGAAETAVAANDNLTSSLQATIDKFRGFADELRKFRDGLYVTEFGEQRGLGAIRAQYNQTAMMAQRGDETALGGLSGVARQYLDAAKLQARTRPEYEAIVAGVIANVNGAVGSANAVADYNQTMLDTQQALLGEVKGLRSDVASLKAENTELRREVQAGNSDARRTREVLEDSSDGTALRVVNA